MQAEGSNQLEWIGQVKLNEPDVTIVGSAKVRTGSRVKF